MGQHRLKYDISYGIYLYHVMIINTFLELNIPLSIGVALLIVLLSFVCGSVSLMIDKSFRQRVEKFKDIYKGAIEHRL